MTPSPLPIPSSAPDAPAPAAVAPALPQGNQTIGAGVFAVVMAGLALLATVSVALLVALK